MKKALLWIGIMLAIASTAAADGGWSGYASGSGNVGNWLRQGADTTTKFAYELEPTIVTTTVFYMAAGAWSQNKLVLPVPVNCDPVSALFVPADGSATDFGHLGFTSSVTGSAPTAGTEEAFWGIGPRINGALANGAWPIWPFFYSPARTGTVYGASADPAKGVSKFTVILWSVSRTGRK